MEIGRDKTSLKGSQGNILESSQPLLKTGGPTSGAIKSSPEKEKVDIESSIPQVSASRERIENEGSEGEKCRFRTLSFIDSFTMNLNLLDRDSTHINDYINVVFDEVIAEPRINQSFDQIWRFAYVVFAGTKYWVYRALTAVLALPLGFFWGLIFSLLCLASVWIITPCLRIVDVILCLIKRVWSGFIQAILDPILQSVGQHCGRGGKKDLNKSEAV